MSLKFHVLKESGRLNPLLPIIEKTCEEAENKITKLIQVRNVDIVILDNPFATIPEIGVGGHTYSPHIVIVSLDPLFSNLQSTLYIELFDTLAHELHHAARWQAIGYGENLLEAIVSEGLADHFAIEVTGRKDTRFWDKALTKKQAVSLIKKAETEYSNKNYNHDAWFFGSKDKTIPRWTAYTLGFQLVENYLKNNLGSKASTLYNVDATKFK